MTDTEAALWVALDDIALRPDWQVRDGLKDWLVYKYETVMRNGVEMPPITLARVNGALVLIDGWHRLHAAKRLGRDHLYATVQDMTEGDAAWAAALANTTHGLQLKRTERFKVFQRYMDDKRYLVSPRSQRIKTLADIVKDLNGLYSRSGVHKLIQENYPHVASRMSRGSGERRGPPADLANKPATAFAGKVREHVQQILAVARGLSAEEREGAAELLEELAEAVRTATQWEEEKLYDL